MRHLIINAKIINENKSFRGAVLVSGNFIEDIFTSEVPEALMNTCKITDAKGNLLLPGVIDDQVHFRDFELAYKGDIATESKAAISGGVTSFMDMPNTIPQTTTQERMNEKFRQAEKNSYANYSFYMGATNDNIEEILKTKPKEVCGVKIFMGSSTGNMLVDNPQSLSALFEKCPLLIAVHCEDEAIIRKNTDKYKKEFGDSLPIAFHPRIRNNKACLKSSSLAIKLAQKYDTRLHILHISTAEEVKLLQKLKSMKQIGRISSEVCVHHLWFDDSAYAKHGTHVKWNPAIKSNSDKMALIEGLKNATLDVVATDHAPHTLEEKNNTYWNAPSGAPMVQHSLSAMLELYKRNIFSLETIVDKMCHAPARLFNIHKRGFIRKGYFADLTIVDLNNKWTVDKKNILYKCAWSPMEGTNFHAKVTHTFVNGIPVFENGKFAETKHAMKLQFDR
ncbi:MAG: dihydroorotase [Bacteroidia bacterium]|nr:MAG: dihydroorotase [Bacteroidia bacterium]